MSPMYQERHILLDLAVLIVWTVAVAYSVRRIGPKCAPL